MRRLGLPTETVACRGREQVVLSESVPAASAARPARRASTRTAELANRRLGIYKEGVASRCAAGCWQAVSHARSCSGRCDDRLTGRVLRSGGDLPVEIPGEVVVQVMINGEVRDIDEGMTVARLLEELELEPRLVAVERNRQLVPRAQHAQCLLEPEDRIEIVTLTGGG